MLLFPIDQFVWRVAGSVYIKDVPAQAKESDMRELFKVYGSIANVNVVAARGYAFVDFYELESMRAALAADASDFKLFDKTLLVEERVDRKGAAAWDALSLYVNVSYLHSLLHLLCV